MISDTEDSASLAKKTCLESSFENEHDFFVFQLSVDRLISK